MPNYCAARTWRGVQCNKLRAKNEVFCALHTKCMASAQGLPYGRYDKRIHPNILQQYLHRAAVCEKAVGFKYYSRDRMWDEAKKFAYANSVEDFHEDDFWSA